MLLLSALDRIDPQAGIPGLLNDRGRAMLAALEGERVDTSPSLVDDEASTGVALIMVDERGQKMIMTAPGANLELAAVDIERRFENARVVLTQLEAGAQTAAAIARQGRETGALVGLDAGPAVPLPDEVLRDIDVVRCNAGEARVLTGIEVTGVDSARAAAQDLRRRGAGAACISTKGGDLLVFEVDEVWLPHQHVEVVDTTGAGDAFAAGIAVGLAEGKSLSEAAWLGCVASALKTTRVGAQAGLPRRSEVDAMLQTIKRD
jgi:ribokinase